jgi:acyl-CoA synthetase (AMP-forming)/AMP-acid ligase II
VRGMVAGAAPPAAMIEGMAKLGIDITHVYGLTEVYGPAAVAVKRPAWAGESLSEQTRLNGRQGTRYVLQEGMTVMDPRTMREVPADGETMGEIMFRGNIVMKGYLKNPAATAKAFEGGWFHTGDLAVMEPDRYVKIKDRSKDVIISGGENISSIEVEDVLYRHPAVMVCAVVARCQVGRNAAGLRGAQARLVGERRRADCVLQGPARRLQGAARSEIRGDPQDLDRQDPEVPAARAGEVQQRDRMRCQPRGLPLSASAGPPCRRARRCCRRRVVNQRRRHLFRRSAACCMDIVKANQQVKMRTTRI